MKIDMNYVLENLQGYVCDPKHFDRSMSWLGLKYVDTTDWEHISNDEFGTEEIWFGHGYRFVLSICHYRDAIEIQSIGLE